MNRNRTLKVSRGRADRDPMFAPVWYDGTEMLVTVPVRDWAALGAGPGPVELAELPPPSDMQQNDHVMRYWTWRLDRMEARRNG